MKAKTRSTQIRIETHEVKVVRFAKRRSSQFCRKCGKNVPVLVMENADDAMDLAIFELVRLVQIQNVHLVDVSDGSVLICGSSLNEP